MGMMTIGRFLTPKAEVLLVLAEMKVVNKLTMFTKPHAFSHEILRCELIKKTFVMKRKGLPGILFFFLLLFSLLSFEKASLSHSSAYLHVCFQSTTWQGPFEFLPTIWSMFCQN